MVSLAVLVQLLCLAPAFASMCEGSPAATPGCTCTYGCSGNCAECCPVGQSIMGCDEWLGCCNNPPTPPTTIAPTFAPNSCEALPANSPSCICTYGCNGNCGGCCPVGQSFMGCDEWTGCCNGPPTSAAPTVSPTPAPTDLCEQMSPDTLNCICTWGCSGGCDTCCRIGQSVLDCEELSGVIYGWGGCCSPPPTPVPTISPTRNFCELLPANTRNCICTYGCSGNCECCPLGQSTMACDSWPGCCNNPPTPPTLVSTIGPTTHPTAPLTRAPTPPTHAPGTTLCEASPANTFNCVCTYGCSGNCPGCCPVGQSFMGCVEWVGCCNLPPPTAPTPQITGAPSTTSPTTKEPTTAVPTTKNPTPPACEESLVWGCYCTYGCSGVCGECCGCGQNIMQCATGGLIGCCNSDPTLSPTTPAPTTPLPPCELESPPHVYPGSCICTYGCNGNCHDCCPLGQNFMSCAQLSGCCNGPPHPSMAPSTPAPTASTAPTIPPVCEGSPDGTADCICTYGCSEGCGECCPVGQSYMSCNEWPVCCNTPPPPPTMTPFPTSSTSPPPCDEYFTPGCICTYGCSGVCGECCDCGQNVMNCGTSGLIGCCNPAPTLSPTTHAPTTLPTTEEPTTTTPTSREPTTTAPTTKAPTSKEPTTTAPTPLFCEAQPINTVNCQCRWGCNGKCKRCCPAHQNTSTCPSWLGCCRDGPVLLGDDDDNNNSTNNTVSSALGLHCPLVLVVLPTFLF